MKIVLLLIPIMLFTACVQIEMSPDGKTLQIKTLDEKTSYTNEIRVTSAGFDKQNITIAEDDILTIIVMDDLRQHTLTLDGEKFTERNLVKGDRVDIPFRTVGTYELQDKTAGSLLIVKVQ